MSTTVDEGEATDTTRTATAKSAIELSDLSNDSTATATTASALKDDDGGDWIDTSQVRNPIWRLLKISFGHKLLMTTAMIGSVLNKIFDLAPPLLTAWVVDSIAGNPPDWLVAVSGDRGNADGSHPERGSWRIPIAILIITVLIFFFESFFQWMYQICYKILAQRVQHEMRTRSYAVMQEVRAARLQAARAKATRHARC